MLNLPHQVSQIALGKDHALLLASEGTKLFAFGSNQWGQLGVAAHEDSEQSDTENRMRFMQSYEHPITCESVAYTSEPIPVAFYDQIE